MKKAVLFLSLLVFLMNFMGLTIKAVETDGDLTYINDSETEYFNLVSGKDASGNELKWDTWKADNQYKGDQLFSYGYPQKMTDPEDGWTMPTLTFAFKGTYVGIISVSGNDQGWMDITLDGKYQGTVRAIDSEAVDASAIWDEAPSSLLIWEASGLADAQHIVTIQPTNRIDGDVNWSKCNIDAMVVKGNPIKVVDVDPNATVPPATSPTPANTPSQSLEPTEQPQNTPSGTVSIKPSTGNTDGLSKQTDVPSKKGFPWIIVIIVVVIAAAGVGSYFIILKKKK